MKRSIFPISPPLNFSFMKKQVNFKEKHKTIHDFFKNMRPDLNLVTLNRATVALNIICELPTLNNEDGRKPSILLPAYFCGTVIEALIKKNVDVLFYDIDEDFSLCEKEITNLFQTQKPNIFILVHYFGAYKTYDWLESLIIRHQTVLIHDCVQFFDPSKIGHGYGHFWFTSIYKNFPTPDGAFIFINEKLLEGIGVKKNDLTSLSQKASSFNLHYFQSSKNNFIWSIKRISQYLFKIGSRTLEFENFKAEIPHIKKSALSIWLRAFLKQPASSLNDNILQRNALRENLISDLSVLKLFFPKSYSIKQNCQTHLF